MARVFQAAIAFAFIIVVAQATCTPVGYDESNSDAASLFVCSLFTDLPVTLLADSTLLPSAVATQPVVYYRFPNQQCAGHTPDTIQVYEDHTCASISYSTNVLESATCSPDQTIISKYAFNDNGQNCFTANGITNYTSGGCYQAGAFSFVYLCPGDLTIPCSITNTHEFRNFYTLECVPQTIYTDPIFDVTGAVEPDSDVSPYKNCDIYFEEQVSSGYAVVAGGNKYCCQHRGVINNGICEQGTCGGYTISSDYFYGNASSTADNQYCYNDCNGFGNVDVFAEQIVHYNGPFLTGAPEAYDTTLSNATDTTIYVSLNVTDAPYLIHEVGYYIVPAGRTPEPNDKTILIDQYHNSDYGCRFKGVYSTPSSVKTCTVFKGCNNQIQTAYLTGFLYDAASNTCFAECLTEGQQFAYPLLTSTRKRHSVQQANRASKQLGQTL